MPARNLPLRRPPPPPKPPPPARPQPSVTATGYHAPPARQPLTAMADIRMTRSGWLGATAVGVLILLGIGLSMDSGDPSRLSRTENVPAAASTDAAHAATGEDATVDSGQAADPPPTPPVPAASDPVFLPAPGSVPRLPPRRLSFSRAPFRPESAPETKLPNVLKAPLPSSGQAPDHTRFQTNDSAHRALLAQMTADLADLQANHSRIKPAVVRLSRQHTREVRPQDAAPIWTGIRPLEERTRPTPTLAASPSPPTHAAPVRPFIASTVISASARPADKPAPKPKALEPSAPSFITWGK